MDALNDILRSFRGEYNKTPVKIQVAHLLLVGSFPFNSFLAGFLSCVAFCVLTVCLRMQIDPSNADFKGMSPERAFADYVLCNGLLHLVIWNFMG
ncbi:MAG: defender against cell death [Trebouxia sp. A1-2]|nr:MAG: defender against cell death [Trebouxia sp. A1-2]